MRVVAILVFLIGVALAGGGAYYAAQFFDRYEKALAAQKRDNLETVKIVVASRDMGYGHLIEANEVKFAQWPKESLPSGVFTTAKDFLGSGERQRTVIQPLRAGEPVTSAKVTDLGEKPRLAYQLDEGKRAFSFPINATTAVAGFVQAGDRVDLLLTRKINGQTLTQVFMQDVEIIAIDQRTDRTSKGARVGRLATIQVDPIDAQRLTIAQTTGRFSLVLRGANEVVKDEPEQLVPLTTNDVFGIKPKEKAPVKERTTVKVRKGGQVQDVTVD